MIFVIGNCFSLATFKRFDTTYLRKGGINYIGSTRTELQVLGGQFSHRSRVVDILDGGGRHYLDGTSNLSSQEGTSYRDDKN